MGSSLVEWQTLLPPLLLPTLPPPLPPRPSSSAFPFLLQATHPLGQRRWVVAPGPGLGQACPPPIQQPASQTEQVAYFYGDLQNLFDIAMEI